MKQVKEATMVKVFVVDGEQRYYKKVSALMAADYDDSNSDRCAIQALHRNSLSWFVPTDMEESLQD